MKISRYGKHIRFEGTTWPIHFVVDKNDDTQWKLRYGSPTREDLLFAASVMNAYSALVMCTPKRRREVVKALRGQHFLVKSEQD